MATALPPSSQIALRACVSVFCAGKWDINIGELLSYVRQRHPIMGPLVERSDIVRALRAHRFRRDHPAGRDAWKFELRDHPFLGRAAIEARAARKMGGC